MSDQNEMMKKTLEDLGIPEKDVKRKARIINNISIDDIYEALGLPLDPEYKPWALKDPTPFEFEKKMFHMPDPEPEPAPSDSVNHPSHYTFGDIEVIDYIRDKLTPEEFQGYCNGNVLKYISRWRHKGGVEDLKKADVYLCWMIESALGEHSNPIRKNYRADDEKRRSV